MEDSRSQSQTSLQGDGATTTIAGAAQTETNQGPNDRKEPAIEDQQTKQGKDIHTDQSEAADAEAEELYDAGTVMDSMELEMAYGQIQTQNQTQTRPMEEAGQVQAQSQVADEATDAEIEIMYAPQEQGETYRQQGEPAEPVEPVEPPKYSEKEVEVAGAVASGAEINLNQAREQTGLTITTTVAASVKQVQVGVVKDEATGDVVAVTTERVTQVQIKEEEKIDPHLANMQNEKANDVDDGGASEAKTCQRVLRKLQVWVPGIVIFITIVLLLVSIGLNSGSGSIKQSHGQGIGWILLSMTMSALLMCTVGLMILKTWTASCWRLPFFVVVLSIISCTIAFWAKLYSLPLVYGIFAILFSYATYQTARMDSKYAASMIKAYLNVAFLKKCGVWQLLGFAPVLLFTDFIWFSLALLAINGDGSPGILKFMCVLLVVWLVSAPRYLFHYCCGRLYANQLKANYEDYENAIVAGMGKLAHELVGTPITPAIELGDGPSAEEDDGLQIEIPKTEPNTEPDAAAENDDNDDNKSRVGVWKACGNYVSYLESKLDPRTKEVLKDARQQGLTIFTLSVFVLTSPFFYGLRKVALVAKLVGAFMAICGAASDDDDDDSGGLLYYCCKCGLVCAGSILFVVSWVIEKITKGIMPFVCKLVVTTSAVTGDNYIKSVTRGMGASAKEAKQVHGSRLIFLDNAMMTQVTYLCILCSQVGVWLYIGTAGDAYQTSMAWLIWIAGYCACRAVFEPFDVLLQLFIVVWHLKAEWVYEPNIQAILIARQNEWAKILDAEGGRTTEHGRTTEVLYAENRHIQKTTNPNYHTNQSTMQMHAVDRQVNYLPQHQKQHQQQQLPNP